MRVIYCALVILLIFAAGCGGGESEPPITIGDVVKTVSKADDIICATTQDNFKEYGKYSVADDFAGVEQMYNRGQIFLLKTGTKVKVIQVTFSGTEVRVMEGPHKDKIAWLARDFLEK